MYCGEGVWYAIFESIAGVRWLVGGIGLDMIVLWEGNWERVRMG
jgi:hypothetical protein